MRETRKLVGSKEKKKKGRKEFGRKGEQTEES